MLMIKAVRTVVLNSWLPNHRLEMTEGQEELQQKKPFVLPVFALLVFHFEDFFEP